MNRQYIAALKILAVAIAILALVFLFPKALEFVEGAAVEARYLWWLILLLALAAWLIWGLGSKKK